MRDAITAGEFEAFQGQFHAERARGDIDPL
jgi:hypothetical protein